MLLFFRAHRSLMARIRLQQKNSTKYGIGLDQHYSCLNATNLIFSTGDVSFSVAAAMHHMCITLYLHPAQIQNFVSKPNVFDFVLFYFADMQYICVFGTTFHCVYVQCTPC